MRREQSKSERMELRREIGNRVIAGPNVPPYHRGPAYLVPHACFGCRKSWKLAENASGVCPHCGDVAHSMGRAFKAPRRGDTDQWRKVEALWRAGFRFLSNAGSYGGAPYPKELRDVEAFIIDNPMHPFRVKQ